MKKSVGLIMGTKFNDYLAEQLKDPEFRKEFEALQAERASKQAEHIPNEETIAALEEAKRMMADPDSKTYSVEEALKELKEEKLK